jgi:hypothetical protein
MRECLKTTKLLLTVNTKKKKKQGNLLADIYIVSVIYMFYIRFHKILFVSEYHLWEG